jgi:hypothetical protein
MRVPHAPTQYTVPDYPARHGLRSIDCAASSPEVGSESLAQPFAQRYCFPSLHAVREAAFLWSVLCATPPPRRSRIRPVHSPAALDTPFHLA